MSKPIPKAYPFKVYDFLLNGQYADCRTEVDQVLSDRDIAGAVPAFFYRHSITDPKLKYIDFFDGYFVSFGYAPQSHNELRHLDYLLSNVSYDQDSGLLRFMEKRNTMDEKQIEYDTYFPLFQKMLITIVSQGKKISFPLYDNHLSDSEKVEIVFSNAVKILYAFDYLAKHDRFKKLFGKLREIDKHIGRNAIGWGITPILRNVLTRTRRATKGILLTEKNFDKSGITILPEEIPEFKNFLLGNDMSRNILKELKELGVSYDAEEGKLTVDEFYQCAIAPKVWIDNLDRLREESKIAENTTNDTQKVSEQGKESKTVSKSILDFSSLPFDMHYVNILESFGIIDEKQQLAMFERFKITYHDLQSKRSLARKYKDAKACFRSFIRNDIQDNTPNRGAAKNIVYDERMEEITAIYGLTTEEQAQQFKEFREYHTRLGNERANWIGAWNTWLKNYTKTRNSDDDNAPWKTKMLLENRHQIARLVDGAIRRMLQRVDVDPMSVIRGQTKLSDVIVVSVPVPPSMGRGTETLLEFADPALQEQAIAALLKDPLAEFKRKEEVTTTVMLPE